MPDQRTDLIEPIPASPQLDALFDERDSILAGARLDAELHSVRAAEPRADTKAGNLQSLCSGLLLAGLALLSTGRLPGPAGAAGWVAAVLLGVAVALLTAAARPNLGGDFGFVRWARTASDQDLLDAVANEPAADSSGELTRQAHQLRWLSRSLYGKFARIRTAQSLLVTALVLAALAAALTALGR
ncbi:Pycsar system effector family protein (plasmid) [Actinoplanes sp. CA-051413]|uniref:Pycsar system effector family protein n=1 Tax=Actinoplanes sp. CA-051413 TaxID=3239899 RepID=UPI003D974C16